MRIMLMHRTNAHWETGAPPARELVAKVGAMMGELVSSGVLEGGEGLRPSSEGLRLSFRGGVATETPGPYAGANELPASFLMLRAPTARDVAPWAGRLARVFGGDADIDIQPLAEAWDIGMAPRPPGLTTRRWMMVRKATAASEAGEPLTAAQKVALRRLIDELKEGGSFIASEGLRPSREAVRMKFEGTSASSLDGPFAESKELIGGYVLFRADSLAAAAAWAPRYAQAVGDIEVDVRVVDDAFER